MKTHESTMSFLGRTSDNDVLAEKPRDIGLLSIEPVVLKSLLVMSASEIADWAQVGKNTVPQIINRFNIREVTGHGKHRRYRTRDVLQRIAGVRPSTHEEVTLLLKPLQHAAWVSAVLGISVSALSANMRNGKSAIPAAIQLSETADTQQAPRGRRWVPAQIEIYLDDLADPFSKSRQRKSAASTRVSSNVFSEICAGNAARSL
jgi:hypothetical protein